MGSCYASKTVPFPEFQKNIKFEIWDTAGQEKYRSMAKIFYKDAAVAILTYDISRKESFDEIQNFWCKEVLENTSSTKKISKYFKLILVLSVAANKSDLYESEEVPESVGKKFSKDNDALFHATSAKNANGVDVLYIIIYL